MYSFGHRVTGLNGLFGGAGGASLMGGGGRVSTLTHEIQNGLAPGSGGGGGPSAVAVELMASSLNTKDTENDR